MSLQEDFREFVESLNSHKVEYVIVGAHALALHGLPRHTGDIDFFVRPTPANARRVMGVLHAFGFSDPFDESVLVTPGKVIQLGHPPSRIDLLTSLSGVTFDEAWADAVPGKLFGLDVRFLGRESLIRNKRAAGRPKDLSDLATLERRRPESP